MISRDRKRNAHDTGEFHRWKALFTGSGGRGDLGVVQRPTGRALMDSSDAFSPNSRAPRARLWSFSSVLSASLTRFDEDALVALFGSASIARESDPLSGAAFILDMAL